MGALVEKPAREVMDVVVNGSIRAGISVYGLRPPQGGNIPPFPSDYWPNELEMNAHRLTGEQWEVLNWDVVLIEWPRGPAWRAAVRRTFSALIGYGCVVAWLGSEGFFCDPPGLFDPDCMTTGVLAALTADGEFVCRVDPDEPLRTLSDEEMLRLRDAAGGLATAT